VSLNRPAWEPNSLLPQTGKQPRRPTFHYRDEKVASGIVKIQAFTRRRADTCQSNNCGALRSCDLP
jgi:hypothetical protein